MAATNRDLAAGLRDGRIREDFYYRICSDIVTTPSLREQVADQPDDLVNLVMFIARRIVGAEAERVTEEVTAWITGHLGPDYPWRGNIRELEQCVCNVLIRGSYQPLRSSPPDAQDRLADRVRRADLTAGELLRCYCTLVYSKCGSYEQAAQRLGLDRRTVKAKVDAQLLEALSGHGSD